MLRRFNNRLGGAFPARLADEYAVFGCDPIAIGGGIVSFASGCSSLTPSDKTQTMGVYAFGIPGIAVITQSHQTADNAGSDTNAATQSNPVEVSGK